MSPSSRKETPDTQTIKMQITISTTTAGNTVPITLSFSAPIAGEATYRNWLELIDHEDYLSFESVNRPNANINFTLTTLNEIMAYEMQFFKHRPLILVSEFDVIPTLSLHYSSYESKSHILNFTYQAQTPLLAINGRPKYQRK